MEGGWVAGSVGAQAAGAGRQRFARQACCQATARLSPAVDRQPASWPRRASLAGLPGRHSRHACPPAHSTPRTVDQHHVDGGAQPLDLLHLQYRALQGRRGQAGAGGSGWRVEGDACGGTHELEAVPLSLPAPQRSLPAPFHAPPAQPPKPAHPPPGCSQTSGAPPSGSASASPPAAAGRGCLRGAGRGAGGAGGPSRESRTRVRVGAVDITWCC